MSQKHPIYKVILLSLSILIFSGVGLLSQDQYNIWYFGNGAGLDFSGGVPAPLTDGQSNTLEGSSAISNPETGELLFYTDGVTVWDATHAAMPNGKDLKGHWTSAQSALIVPNPEDANIYYVFTAGAGFYHTADDPNNGVRYSVVDMQLNGGRGDVTLKNIELLERGRGVEMLSATRHCNGRDYWVVAHELESNRFLMYLITLDGIADTVISNIGSVLSGDLGTQSMGKFSPNGKMLAVATPGEQVLELYAFDNVTGRLSNHRLLASDWYYYGPEFSPDNSKLYVSSLAISTELDFLYQFDLEAGDLQAIRRSRYELHREEGRWDGAQCQLGPDGRIYVSFINRDRLGVINDPNVQGGGANYEHNGVRLAGKTTSYGLPNCISSDLPEVRSGYFDLSLNVSSFVSTIKFGESAIYEIIVCNNSDVEVRNVSVSYSLPVELTDVSGGSSPIMIPRIAAGECDTLVVEARLDVALSDGKELRICVEIIDMASSECLIPMKNCSSITIGPCDSLYSSCAYIGHHYSDGNGSLVAVPVVVELADRVRINQLQIAVRYDPSMIILNDDQGIELLKGTLLEDWKVLSFKKEAGQVTIDLQAQPGIYLRDTGEILKLHLRMFLALGALFDSDLDLEITVPNLSCIEFQTIAGSVHLDSICGLNSRAIELISGAKYSLNIPQPHPITEEAIIQFSLGLDGNTQLYILDTQGRRVALLVDGFLMPGQYSVEWNVNRISRGVYFCRIESGVWTKMMRLLIE